MNLADASLRSVNASRPTLVHTPSKQSVTASDDYYSLASSEASSNDDRTVIRRYQTPPLHTRAAGMSGDALQSEATIPYTRPVKHTQRTDMDEKPLILPPVTDRHTVTRKPLSTPLDGTIIRRPVAETSPPTPGVDDTPYIQFAIDQLTRDEELLGPRRPGIGSDASYPAERMVKNEELHSQDRRPQRQPSVRQPVQSPTENVLLPSEPVNEGFRYPKLNFVPRSLRIASLGALVFCTLLMIGALIFCAIWPSSHNGLFLYDGFGTSRYFVFEYLPQLLACIIIFWLFTIQLAIHRIFPFVALSSGRSTHNSRVLYDVTLFPTNYLIPNLSLFKHGEPLLGLCSMIFWLVVVFTIPLQSCLFQTRFYAAQDVWRWTTVIPIAWTLFALYLLLAVALVLLLLRIAFHKTGIKWDPVSLADIMVLVRGSNFLADFERSEIDFSTLRNQRPKSLRLGYWRSSKRNSETFYCIGDENAPVDRYPSDRNKTRAINDVSVDLEGQRSMKPSFFDTLKHDIRAPHLRYGWTPWFLRDGMIVAWIVIAIVLMLAFIIISFVNQAVHKGFIPLLPAPTTGQGFSPADFLYSFLPSFIGMILFLLWQPIDIYFRALQPFASLSSSRGSCAERSLLLDYTSCLPIEVTLKATFLGHYKVAWISFVSLMSITLPILSGGIFTAQFVVSKQDVRTVASMPGYYALVVFVIAYALSFLIIWPTRRRHLPHNISTLGELMSFFYQSSLLGETTLNEPRSKVDLVTKLLAVPMGERELPKYAFGIYVGCDGKEHLGIDRLERPGVGEMAVTSDL